MFIPIFVCVYVYTSYIYRDTLTHLKAGSAPSLPSC